MPELGPEIYARWRGSELGSLTERLERSLVLDLVGEVRDRSVLDLGCGDGDLAIALWRGGARVTGLDASPDMIAAAVARARREHADVVFETGSAAALPFPPGQFDVVVAVTILCFVADAAPVFREIARVLRPGGRLVICELGKWSLWAAERRVRAWLGSRLWQRGYFRTAGGLQRLCRQAGLLPQPVRGAIYYPRSTLAARWLAPHDAAFSLLGSVGAAFLGLTAIKSPPPAKAAATRGVERDHPPRGVPETTQDIV